MDGRAWIGRDLEGVGEVSKSHSKSIAPVFTLVGLGE